MFLLNLIFYGSESYCQLFAYLDLACLLLLLLLLALVLALVAERCERCDATRCDAVRCDAIASNATRAERCDHATRCDAVRCDAPANVSGARQWERRAAMFVDTSDATSGDATGDTTRAMSGDERRCKRDVASGPKVHSTEWKVASGPLDGVDAEANFSDSCGDGPQANP